MATIRAAMLARQLFAETLLLAGSASLLSVLLAMWAVPGILYLAPAANLP